MAARIDFHAAKDLKRLIIDRPTQVTLFTLVLVGMPFTERLKENLSEPFHEVTLYRRVDCPQESVYDDKK